MTPSDQSNKVTTYAYDDADRLTSVTDSQTPVGQVTSYAYDTENNLTRITDALLRYTDFEYDALGRLKKTIFPSNLFEEYFYDNNGNLTSKVDRKNQTITYTYDEANRLKTKTTPDPNTVTYTYDLANHLTQVTDNTGIYGFTYDNDGRLTQTSTNYSFDSVATPYTVGYGYDAASNRTSMTDPQGTPTTYVYNTLNQLTSLTSSAGAFGFTYDALGRRTLLTLPNGMNTTYAYDTVSQLLSVQHKLGTTVLNGTSYVYAPAGNRDSRTQLPQNLTTTYQYDSIYQLTSAATPGVGTESSIYDAFGNRTTANNLSSTLAIDYNSSNQITTVNAIPANYDNNGNMLTNPVGNQTYTWDAENRLTSAGITTFKYDPFGRRIAKDGSTYVFDGDNLLERTVNGSVSPRYTMGLGVDEPLAVERGGQLNPTFYYGQDGLGSVTALFTATGTLSKSYAYSSYGSLAPGNTHHSFSFLEFTGRDSDQETGLYYYRARYYDPQIGRFLSEDHLKSFMGPNFFKYARNNPTNLTDPSGLQEVRPNNVVAGTPMQYHVPFADGFVEAMNRLNRPGCAAAFSNSCSTQQQETPQEQLESTRYRFVTLNSPSTGAATVGPTSVFINTRGLYMNTRSGKVQLADGTSVDLGSATNARAFLLLHELGHQANLFFPDAGPSLAGLNAAQSLEIIRACFNIPGSR